MAKRKAAPAEEVRQGYTVLARRYRPQGFDDLVGQEPVAQGLINALQSGRVAHAYLFTGARGVGKTSTARILAKALNCEKGPTATPCGQCYNCRAIATGDDVDVLEIDGASNNSVDEVRELRNNVQFRPSRSRYKIYIIDEVHMLTKAAFNALLKTLEEPPAHVKFIFATTEVEKIPITILSRCQRFDFAGIGSARIVERLKDIVASEGMQADEEALEILARRAGGSMRDAQSLLDQLLAFGGERLTVEQVHRLLGTASDDRVADLATAALERQPARALELLEKAETDGLQLGELVDQLIGYWRDLMVVNAAGPEAPALSVGSKHRAALLEQAKRSTLDTLLAGLDILSTTRARLRSSNHGRILIEMALLRLGRLDDLLSLVQLAEAVAGGQVAAAANPPTSPRITNVTIEAGPIKGPEDAITRATGSAGWPDSSKKNSPTPAQAGPSPKETFETSATSPGARVELTPASLAAIWGQVLAQQGQVVGHDLGKAGLPAISGPNTLVLRFSPSYNATCDRCRDPEIVERIEQQLLQLTGQKWGLRIESSGGQPDPLARIAEEPDKLQSRLPTPREEAAEPPLLQWARDLLGAKPIKADPGFGAPASAAGERAGQADTEEP